MEPTMNFWDFKMRQMRAVFGPNRYELDYYPAPHGKEAPFALIAPGGGYVFMADHFEGKPFALEINKRGYHAFVLRYHTKQKAFHPGPLMDMVRAVREILDNAEKYKVKKTGYSVWGSSAGGHLAACFSSELLGWKRFGLPKPATTVLVYPVITMGEEAHKGSRNQLIGRNPSRELVREWSIEHQVTKDFPPTYIFNSDTDTVVPPVNSHMFVEAAKKAGILYQYHRYKSGKHGCGPDRGGPCDGWIDEAIDFWKTNITGRVS